MKQLLLFLFLAAMFAALLSCVTTDWQKQKAKEPLKPNAWYADKE